MIQLFIDGQEAALPPDFSFTLYEENPVYTKNEKYTYDLTLSLKNFINASIYGHIDRVNIENGFQYNRRAVLVVDNKVSLDGTEIILAFGDSDVKIQLASGKSELNFLIGGDRKVRDLDLGEGIISYTPDFQDIVKGWLSKSYPEREWQILPYYTWDHDLLNVSTHLAVGNQYATVSHDNKFNYYLYGTYGIITPQPYFCFIIKKILESIGYTLSSNSIGEHPILKNCYIVNGIQTRFFAEMLPDWTIKDFFSKIEFFFDCAIIINEKNKTVDILFKYETENGAFGKQTLIVDDEYNAEEDKENALDIRNSNTAYDLDNNDYHKYARIDDRYYQMCEKVPYGTLNEMRSLVMADDDLKTMKIFTNTIYGDFMAYYDGTTYIPRKIHIFQPLYNNSATKDIDTTLGIIPASMASVSIKAQSGPMAYWMQVPGTSDYDELDYTRSQTPSPEINKYFVLQDLIEGTTSLEKTVPSKIRLAIYSGLKEIDIDTSRSGGNNIKGLYPVSYVESLAEYYPESNIKRFFMDYNENPFRFSYLYNDIYQKYDTFDTTIPYKFSFELKEDFNIRSTFIIRNREFVCYKVEKEVTNDGFKKIALGYFYPKRKKEE